MAIYTQDAYKIAHEVLGLAEEFGFTVTPKTDVLTVVKQFTPNDRDAYAEAEHQANTLLRLVPMTGPGSVWGTDGLSIGGFSGLTGGYMRLNKSGVSRRVLNAIRKLQSS